jgi:protein involved in polysaccharide export with SLBB domain
LRKIKIRHKDGTESAADIERFVATGESKCNPLLQDGDVVIVPPRNIMKDFVGVYGAVNGEGTYEFVEGDSLMSMIQIARGCSPLADSSQVKILRTDAGGNTMQTISIDMRAIAAGASPNIPLQRGDRIVVREKMELRRDYKVRVEGEVLYPGNYPITKDSTKLTDLIKVAGGFTDFASLSMSKLFRRSVTEKEISSERLESARGGVTPEDSAYFYLETNVRLNRELVVVDFVSLFSGHDESKDVYVRDEDEIFIASQQKTIYVFGQVVHPGHVAYVSGKSYDFYVSLAGGFTEYARSSDTRIIKATTKQWLKPDETTIQDGDYVWVPKEPYRPFGYYMQIYGELFSIIGTLATLVVLAVQLKK